MSPLTFGRREAISGDRANVCKGRRHPKFTRLDMRCEAARRSSARLCHSVSSCFMINVIPLRIVFREAMQTVEDVLGSLRTPTCQRAPSWRVRITFNSGLTCEEMYDPRASWPMPLATSPPARFIARQSMNLVRFYWREHGMAAACLRIVPPPGTVDDCGRKVQTLLAILKF